MPSAMRTRLLGRHGVFVRRENIRQANQRAVTLEWRCRLAWRVEALGRPAVALAPHQVQDLEDSINRRGGYLPHLFASMARREIRLDPRVVD
jgi:ribulose-5-phosphate 4-epimerase/fuculose-1-phosphate aldolase